MLLFGTFQPCNKSISKSSIQCKTEYFCCEKYMWSSLQYYRNDNNETEMLEVGILQHFYVS